jgi:Tfp pilus assembly protein FimT
MPMLGVSSSRGRVHELRDVRSRWAGISLLELLAVLGIAMVLLAIGLPAFLRMLHTVQLSDGATKVADILRAARYDAIRQNKSISCIFQPWSANAGMTVMWVDSNRNGTQDPTEAMTLLTNGGNLVDPGGVPNTATLIAQAVGSLGTTPWTPGGGSIAFDARGAVNPPLKVNVFYLENFSAPEVGFRAVLLMPTGSLQIWSADTSGNWTALR